MSNTQNTTLHCRVRKSGEGYEGTISIPGLRATKLAKKDESTVYANRSGVAAAAKALADRLGYTLEVEDNTPTAKTAPKKTTAKSSVSSTSTVVG
jgi:hypothetical protein